MLLSLLFLAAVVMTTDTTSQRGVEEKCEPNPTLDILSVTCYANNTQFTIKMKGKEGKSMEILFEKGSSLTCNDLQRAKPHIDKFMLPVEQRKKQLKILKIKDVMLSSVSLSCLLHMLHLGCDILTFERAKGELLPTHVEGFEDIKKLRLLEIDENVTSVPYDVLSHLPSVHSFILTGAALVLRTEHVELPQLTTLELSWGHLEYIPRGAFSHLPNLNNLQLFNNKIEFVDVDAFKGLSKLERLSLDNNCISTMPAGVFRHTANLLRLDIDGNRFSHLTENVFKGLMSVTMINLINNKNALTVHSRTFANLPALAQLTLDGSFIQMISSDAFTNSTKLQNLSFDLNKLTNLSEYIFLGLKLKTLSLTSNRLNRLSGNLFLNQTELQRLELQRNSLTELPVDLFKDLNNLEILNLKYNSIEKLNDSVFVGLSKLKKLYLSWNKIKTVTKGLFQGLTNIESILLSHNYISIIGTDWRKFHYLEYLNLSHNNITTLLGQDTYFPTNAVIDLSSNKIQYLDLHSYTKRKGKVIINNNPFICNCSLFSFINYTHQNKYNVLPSIRMGDAKCFQPSHLNNTKLTDLRPDMLSCDTTCPTDCSTCLLRPDTQQVELTCTKSPENWPNLSNDYNSISIKLQKLDNRYLNLPSTVHYLDVSNLTLAEPPILQCDTPLVVNLTRNLLKTPSIDLLGKNCQIYIEHNPIECECSQEINIQKMFLYNVSIKDFNILRCSDQRLISTLDVKSLCYTRNAIIAVSVISLIITLVTIAFVIVSYRDPTLVRILIKKLCCFLGNIDLSNYKYDAFISFVDDDEIFVTEKVIPNLEKSSNALKLCIHSRDWVIGEMIPSQIKTSVEQSRKTIIILSRNYLESKWCEMEFRMAHSMDRVIILMLEDFSKDASLSPELKAYISLKTYVKVSDPLVWARLKYAVQQNNNKIEQTDKSISVGLDSQLNEDGMIVNKATTSPAL